MIQAVLVDDEQLSLMHLEKQLKKTKKVEVVAKYSNATDLLIDLKGLVFDTIFLDIEIPGLNGLNLARLIKERNPTVSIVFVTAYRSYAVQAFELQATDYLLKPILPERLEKTIQRVQTRLDDNLKKIGSPLTSSQAHFLKIVCFKEFNVYQHEVPIKWKTSKVKELFAYLLTNLNEYIRRDNIIENLWPDIEFERAKIQLHTTMSYLRKKLETLGYSNSIHFSHGSYILNLEEFECDVYRFEQVINDFPIITSENIELFEKIVEEYSEDYMVTNGYEWAVPIASALRKKLLQVLQKMVDYYTKHEIKNKTHHYLQLLLSYNPYSDHVITQLMQFYAENGNRAEAVRTYHEMKTLLSDELGILPDHKTTKLYNSILK